MDDLDAETNAITGDIVDAAVRVHTLLGPGLLERVYVSCMAHELASRGRRVRREVAFRIVYDGITLEDGYRADMLVDDRVLAEIKAVDVVHKVHFAQVSTYLKLTRLPVGILLNFNSVPMKNGIHRIVNPRRNDTSTSAVSAVSACHDDGAGAAPGENRTQPPPF